MVYLHEPLGSSGCPACTFRGVPLEFDREEDWRAFARECLVSYWGGALPQAPVGPPSERPSGIRRPWVVCAECLSPWVVALPAQPTRVLCRLCGGEREPRSFLTREEWAARVRERAIAGTAGPPGPPGPPREEREPS